MTFGQYKYTSAVSRIWLEIELVCDDPRNTMLMMPSSLSHYCLEGEAQGRDEKVGKYCEDGLGYGDYEVRVSRVWEETGGKC